ncbi:hypothetical protein YC2023_008807 [Brassica napus]
MKDGHFLRRGDFLKKISARFPHESSTFRCSSGAPLWISVNDSVTADVCIFICRIKLSIYVRPTPITFLGIKCHPHSQR